MHAKLSHGQRGQALVETVIFLPMFLIALFGIIWTVQAAVQYERVESAVRYAGLITQNVNPYENYSLYSMYGQLGSQTIPTVSCTAPLTAPLSDAAPTYVSASATTASAPFWSPSTSTPPVPSCPFGGLVGFQSGSGLTQDVILSEQQPGMTSAVTLPSSLVAAIGTTFSSSYAKAYFFKAVGENVLIACYPALNTQITSSLQYQTDTAPADPPVALASVVVPVYLSAATACVNP